MTKNILSATRIPFNHHVFLSHLQLSALHFVRTLEHVPVQECVPVELDGPEVTVVQVSLKCSSESTVVD